MSLRFCGVQSEAIGCPIFLVIASEKVHHENLDDSRVPFDSDDFCRCLACRGRRPKPYQLCDHLFQRRTGPCRPIHTVRRKPRTLWGRWPLGRFYGKSYKHNPQHFSRYGKHRSYYHSYGRSYYDRGYGGHSYGYSGKYNKHYYRNPYRFQERGYGYRYYNGYRGYCR